MKNLIARYNNILKQGCLKLLFTHKYAFVGIGNHSINNLYSIINYFGLPLKYILTKSLLNAKLISDNFQGVKGINDIDIIRNGDEIKGVFISSLPDTNFQLIKAFIEADKFVFVEKPPSFSDNELNEFLSLSKGTQCVVGMQRRYAPIF